MIKKIMSVIASVIMFGSTVMFASASATSGMFGVNTNINAPGSLDAPAANTMTSYIASLNISESNRTIVDGEMDGVKTSSQPLYLGDVMSVTKSTFTSDQLPNVLASGDVNGDDGTDYEYNLKIDVPNSAVKYGEPDSSLNKAIIYSDFSNDEFYNLRIVFPTAVEIKQLAGETIHLFGKEYTFSEDENDLKNDLVLFEKSSSVIINSGETQSIQGHSIKVDVEDDNSAVVYVDGISKNVDDDWSGKINGVDVYVKNIFASNVYEGSRYVQLSLNSQKLVLSNGEEVEKGTKTLDGTDVVIKKSDNKVSEVVIKVIPNNVDFGDDEDLEYLKLGNSFVDPVFETVSFRLDSLNPDLTDEDRDYIKLKTSGEKGAVIEFTNKAGKDYTFSFIDDSKLNFLMSNITEDEYFITGSNEYTQIWKVEDINNNNIKVKDQGKNSDSITLSLISGSTSDLSLADGSSTKITRNGEELSVDKVTNFVYTEKGAKISLGNSGVLKLTQKNTTTWQPIVGGISKTIEYSISGNGLNIKDIPVGYTLIYYPDTLGLDGVKSNDDFTTNVANIKVLHKGHNDVSLPISIDVGDNYCGTGLNPNATVCKGAKLWLIPGNETEALANVSSWKNMENSLFETDLVNLNTKVIIEEETPYNGGNFKNNNNSELGKVIDVEIKNPTSDISLSLNDNFKYTYSEDDNTESVTDYGTYINEYKDEKIEFYYPESAMSINFNIGEMNYTVNNGFVEGSVNEIILGGSCINQAAADLLGIGRLCGIEFTNATGIGVNQAMIKTFAKADGKIAILVAGYETADTLRGTQYLKNNPTEFSSAGVSKII